MSRSATITQYSRGVTNLATRNVGHATINGVEVEAEWLMTDATRLHVDAQYLDALYDDFRYVTPLSAGPPVSGCVVAPQAAGFQVDCSGQRAPYAPEWTVNLVAEQWFDLRNGTRVTALARVRYQSVTLTGLDVTPLAYQDGSVALGASITYTPGGDNYYVTAYINNVTHETVIASTFQLPFGSFVVGTLRPLRLYGVRLGAHF